MRRLLAPFLLAVVVAAGCTASEPSRSPTPTPGPALTTAQLRLALAGDLGQLWYCDPDVYPLARGEEIDRALERWPEVLADAEAFVAITDRLGIAAVADPPDDQKLAIYRAWKVLNATLLDPAGDGGFRFDYLAQPAPGAAEGTRTSGTIDRSGRIIVEAQGPAPEPMCPICLARGTRIDAPGGALAVDRLRVGDRVWTLDADGRRVEGLVIAVGSTGTPATHRVVRLVLADGRSVTASPGHPLADGRRLGDLRAGDVVDGVAVLGADLVRYGGSATFDLAVSGPTGRYLVDGIALGSTIDPRGP